VILQKQHQSGTLKTHVFSYWLSLALLFGFASLAQSEEAATKDDFARERKEGDTAKDALEGKAPPELKVAGWMNTGGKELQLADLTGKVVVLDFWGTWCGPCRAAMRPMKELYAKHKNAGLVVIGIHTTDKGDDMAKYVEHYAIPWPCAIDVDDETVSAFKVDGYPDYHLIDKSGNLRCADLANKEVERAVEALLKE
jgi:cytochrome c biogenesis protein CcmG/thiol:disulfide interchange protein DsbE